MSRETDTLLRSANKVMMRFRSLGRGLRPLPSIFVLHARLVLAQLCLQTSDRHILFNSGFGRYLMSSFYVENHALCFAWEDRSFAGKDLSLQERDVFLQGDCRILQERMSFCRKGLVFCRKKCGINN